MAGPRLWRVTLDDGRVVELSASDTIRDEDSARRYAQRWAAINAADGEVGNYNVTLDDGSSISVPATSPEAAQRFVTEVYTPTGRAYADAQERAASTPGQVRALNQGFTYNLITPLDAAGAAAETGVNNFLGNMGIGDGAGYGMGDAFNAVRSAEGAAARDFAESNPVQSIGLNVTGGLLNPLTRVGGRFAAGQRGGQGLLASQELAPIVARSAALGAGTGAVAGAAGSEPGDELGATGRGALLGGLVGGGAPVAGRVASATARYTGLDQLPAVANRMTGGRVPALNGSVDRRALARLSESLRQDGVSEDQLRTAMNEATRRGITPNLLDLIGPNATRTRSLIVGAAQAPGPGMTAGAQYANDVRGTLTDDAIEQAYRLTPGETRTAAAYADDLGRTNRQLADELYAEPYQARVLMTDETRRALNGMGPQMNAARQESSFRFPDQAQDIAALASGGADDVSAAALDRINRQIAQAGRNAGLPGDSQNLGLAADYGARSGALNETLDAVPGLLPARSTFRGYANAQEGVDVGRSALQPQTRPADYLDQLDTLQRTEAISEMGAGIPIPSAREAAGVGLRDEIVQRLGREREGAIGALNGLAGRAEGNNARQVLEGTYGPDSAEIFQGGMGMLRDRGALANFMDSTRGSPTAGRLTAGGMADAPGIPATLQAAIGVLSKIRRGVTLTDADREALVRIGTQFRQQPQFQLGPRGAPVSGRAVPILAQQAGE